MIVFLDVDKQIVFLYTDSGIKKIPFNNISILEKMIGQNEIMYVTQIIKTNAKEITKTVLSVSGISPKKSTSNEPLYLRSKKGYVLINDIKLTLKGPTDFQPLNRIYDEFGKDIFEKNKTLQNLLKSGVVEIITYSDMIVLQQDEATKIDKELGSILIETSVDDFMDNKGKSGSPGQDAVVIEIGDEGVRNIKEINTEENEGTLLPDDMLE
jgi:hypothetical protein